MLSNSTRFDLESSIFRCRIGVDKLRRRLRKKWGFHVVEKTMSKKHGGRSLIGWEDLRKGQRTWSRWAASPVGRDRSAKTFTFVMPPACGRASGQKVERVTVMQKLSHVCFAATRPDEVGPPKAAAWFKTNRRKKMRGFKKKLFKRQRKLPPEPSQSDMTDRRLQSKIVSAGVSIFIDVDEIDVEKTT